MHQNQRFACTTDDVMDLLAAQDYRLWLQAHSPGTKALQLAQEEPWVEIKTQQSRCSEQYQN
jgi:hypothetical protein